MNSRAVVPDGKERKDVRQPAVYHVFDVCAALAENDRALVHGNIAVHIRPVDPGDIVAYYALSRFFNPAPETAFAKSEAVPADRCLFDFEAFEF
jgi:hypothetical protein